MNKVIKLNKGLDIEMTGKAAETVGSTMRPAIFRIVPDHFAGITPKLTVKAGETVKAGTPLFHDKQFADMMFASPVSGTVTEIVRGERRKVLSINIEADPTIAYEKYESNLAEMTGEEVKSLLLKAGIWSYIKQRPYDVIANPTVTPKSVFISYFS